MNNNQRNTFNMCANVDNLGKKNNVILEAVAPLKTAFATFFREMDEFRALVGEKEISGKGFTENKNNSKTIMAKLAASLAKAGRSLAHKLNDSALKAKFDYSKWDLENMPDNIVVEVVNVMIEELQKNITALVDNLVEQADVDKLVVLAAAYRASLSNKTTNATTSVVNTGEVSRRLSSMTTLLRITIDSLVDRLEEKYPTFYNEYFQARKVIDLRGTRKTQNGSDTTTTTDTTDTTDVDEVEGETTDPQN